MPLWAYGFLTGLAVLLVGSATLLVLCMTWRLSGKGPAPRGGGPGLSRSPALGFLFGKM